MGPPFACSGRSAIACVRRARRAAAARARCPAGAGCDPCTVRRQGPDLTFKERRYCSGLLTVVAAPIASVASLRLFAPTLMASTLNRSWEPPPLFAQIAVPERATAERPGQAVFHRHRNVLPYTEMFNRSARAGRPAGGGGGRLPVCPAGSTWTGILTNARLGRDGGSERSCRLLRAFAGRSQSRPDGPMTEQEFAPERYGAVLLC
jgi:hypothetical protein